MSYKLCRKCNTIKSVLEFNKSNPQKDGLQKYCSVCTKKFSRQNKERKALILGKPIKPYEEKIFSRITDEQLLDYIRKFNVENGRPPTTYDFERNPDYPTAYTFYRHFKYKSGEKEKVRCIRNT